MMAQQLQEHPPRSADEAFAGTVIAVRGAVVDIAFPDGNLPAINEALRIEGAEGDAIIAEVQAHLDPAHVRAISLQVKGVQTSAETYQATKALAERPAIGVGPRSVAKAVDERSARRTEAELAPVEGVVTAGAAPGRHQIDEAREGRANRHGRLFGGGGGELLREPRRRVCISGPERPVFAGDRRGDPVPEF